MSSKLYELDPSVIDGKPLPESFTSTVYSPGQMMRRLGITDESEFWLAVRAGRLPPAAWLPTNEPFCVWDREMVETWIEHGCPLNPEVVAVNMKVLPRLVQCVEDSLPAQPVRKNEVN